jgi:hypothetical protein
MTDIVFKLPGVVQCDSKETEEYLRSFDFCKNERTSWQQQYKYKYIISLDGNGATCSRVALTLKSGSLLLKYNSKNILYYFKGLHPWVHYIPISCEQDVENVIKMSMTHGDFHQKISQNASLFYENVLSKINIYKYAAVLINEFYGLFNNDEIYKSAKARIDGLHCLVDITVHVQQKGDIWCWPDYIAGLPDSGIAIEGFSISSAELFLNNKEIEYQCLYQDRSTSSWVKGGHFCGSRGENNPLIGFRMRLLGGAHLKINLEYRATFINGLKGGWNQAGDWCANDGLESMESFELRMIER